ncbi:DUF3553 domain-containing protein [Algisphaera agarilytica]|uniref:DUF3553 domain-containing protein n=1 Tax=Algisphaera agarilytica TaxID=1385975 RepID=A0A7X0LIU9_9BACT|nr:DUF3553 domain-containing protein [Algisphaera agarilytica]MBB6428625.1 hypothetical protein [Algisphaera agarilytica]
MTTPIRFAQGDTVRHPKRPEWGVGTVRSIQAIAQPDGTRAQRLTVDFANQGRKNINTAIAPLIREGEAKPVAPAKPKTRRNTPQPPLPQPKTAKAAASVTPNGDGSAGNGSSGSGWLDAMDPDGAKSNELWDLPDELSDPFASLPERLAATLKTYRFSTEPRALMDWAVVQTGLNDPLSKYTRSELEQAFPRYVRDRDAHLKDLVRQLKRENNFAALKDAGRGLFPAAQSALDKAIRN